MTVAQLIAEWLSEAGEDALAQRVAKKLEENDFAGKEVGFDPGPGAIVYIEKWANEGSFVRLDGDRALTRHDIPRYDDDLDDFT